LQITLNALKKAHKTNVFKHIVVNNSLELKQRQNESLAESKQTNKQRENAEDCTISVLAEHNIWIQLKRTLIKLKQNL